MTNEERMMQAVLAYLCEQAGGSISINMLKLTNLFQVGYELTWEVDGLGLVGKLSMRRQPTVIDMEAPSGETVQSSGRAAVPALATLRTERINEDEDSL